MTWFESLFEKLIFCIVFQVAYHATAPTFPLLNFVSFQSFHVIRRTCTLLGHLHVDRDESWVEKSAHVWLPLENRLGHWPLSGRQPNSPCSNTILKPAAPHASCCFHHTLHFTSLRIFPNINFILYSSPSGTSSFYGTSTCLLGIIFGSIDLYTVSQTLPFTSRRWEDKS